MNIDMGWIDLHAVNNVNLYQDYVSEYLNREITEKNYSKISESILELIQILKNERNTVYMRVPRGYPFYWIGFSLFMQNQYEKAIFYLDAALSEDKHYMQMDSKLDADGSKIHGWKDSGAALFFKLYYYNGVQAYFNIESLRLAISKSLLDFNMQNDKGIQIEMGAHFVSVFVEKMLLNRNTALVTTLYSYILEKSSVDIMSTIKSDFGGTIQPFILHLIKGTLLFESIVKEKYGAIAIAESQAARNPLKHVTLGNLLNCEAFKKKMRYRKKIETSLSDINSIQIRKKVTSMTKCFEIIAKIRNTAAHNLCWDDRFIKKYELLYDCILFGVFYYIGNEYL